MALVANVVRRNSGGVDGSTLRWPKTFALMQSSLNTYHYQQRLYFAQKKEKKLYFTRRG
uniref:Uncharacterized protein n=1 Tax=Oryza glaberrima TaxID=4538 RepID=I1P958_ORYGL